MSDPVDVSKDRKVDWDREISAGHLVRKEPVPGNFDGTDHHVQGVPVTAEEQAAREVPASRMKHVQETGRYPDPPKGTLFFNVGVTIKDGKVVRD